MPRRRRFKRVRFVLGDPDLRPDKLSPAELVARLIRDPDAQDIVSVLKWTIDVSEARGLMDGHPEEGYPRQSPPTSEIKGSRPESTVPKNTGRADDQHDARILTKSSPRSTGNCSGQGYQESGHGAPESRESVTTKRHAVPRHATADSQPLAHQQSKPREGLDVAQHFLGECRTPLEDSSSGNAGGGGGGDGGVRDDVVGDGVMMASPGPPAAEKAEFAEDEVTFADAGQEVSEGGGRTDWVLALALLLPLAFYLLSATA